MTAPKLIAHPAKTHKQNRLSRPLSLTLYAYAYEPSTTFSVPRTQFNLTPPLADMTYGWDSAQIRDLNNIDYAHDRVCLLGTEFERGTATEQEWIDAALEFLHVVHEAVQEHGDQALGEIPARAAFLATEWLAREYLDIADVWDTISELVHATCAVQHISPAALRLIVSHMIRAGQEGIRCSESRPATRIVAWYQHEIGFLEQTGDFCVELYDVVEDIRRGASPLRPVIVEASAAALAQPQSHTQAVVHLKTLLDAVEGTRYTSDDRIRAYAAVFEALIATQHLFPRNASFSRLLVVALAKLVIEAEHYTHRFETLEGVRSIDAMTIDLLLGVFGLAPRPFRPQVLSRLRCLHALQADEAAAYRKLASGFYDELSALYEHMLVTDACNYECPTTMIQHLGINDTFTIDHPDNFIELRSGRIRRQEPTVIARPEATDDVTGHHRLTHTETQETHEVQVIVGDNEPAVAPTPFFGGGRPELAEPQTPAECEYVDWREDPNCAHEFMFAEPDTSDDEDSDRDEYDDCFDFEGECARVCVCVHRRRVRHTATGDN